MGLILKLFSQENIKLQWDFKSLLQGKALELFQEICHVKSELHQNKLFG